MKKEAGHKKTIVIIAAGAAAILLICSLILMRGNKSESYRSIKIVELAGKITIDRERVGSLEAAVNMNLLSGDYVAAAEDAYVVLRLDADKYVMLGQGGAMKVTAEGNETAGRTSIQLDAGSVLSEIQNPLGEDSSFNIVTPNATMSVRGTVFEVRRTENDENGLVSVLVYDGSVAVGLDGKEPILCRKGEFTEFTGGDSPQILTEKGMITKEQMDEQMLRRLQQIEQEGRNVDLGALQSAGTAVNAAGNATQSTPVPEITAAPSASTPEAAVPTPEPEVPEATSTPETGAPAPDTTAAPTTATPQPPVSTPDAVTPEPTSVPVTAAPKPEVTSAPESEDESGQDEDTGETVEPEGTPEPEETPEPEGTPEPEITPEPEGTPEPEQTTEPEETPEPEQTPEPERTPKPEGTPKPDQTPKPEPTPEPDRTPEPVGTPEPTNTPAPVETPSPEPIPGQTKEVTYYLPYIALSYYKDNIHYSDMKDAAPYSYGTVQAAVGDTLKKPWNPIVLATPYGYNTAKADLSFAGWCTENGAAWDFQNDVVQEDMHLYSIWVKRDGSKFYPVIYEAPETGFWFCNCIMEGSTGYEKSEVSGFPEPKREGYVLSGWEKVSQEGSLLIRFRAVWEKQGES